MEIRVHFLYVPCFRGPGMEILQFFPIFYFPSWIVPPVLGIRRRKEIQETQSHSTVVFKSYLWWKPEVNWSKFVTNDGCFDVPLLKWNSIPLFLSAPLLCWEILGILSFFPKSYSFGVVENSATFRIFVFAFGGMDLEGLGCRFPTEIVLWRNQSSTIT